MITSLEVFTPTGTFLTELNDFEIQSVIWRLATGQAQIFVPYASSKCLPEYLRAGNLLLIEFSDLPDFAGVMGYRGRGADGITMRAAQPDKLLSWRYTGPDLTYSASRNSIAQGIIALANAEYDTLVDAGSEYSNSETAQTAYTYQQLLGAIQDLATGEDYEVAPYRTGTGHLRFMLNWSARRGVDRRDTVVLAEGTTVGDMQIDEQEPFYNQVIVVGADDDEGTSWSGRPTAIAIDRDSVTRHGLRTAVPIIRNDISDADTLHAIADAEIAQQAWPQLRATLRGVISTANVPFGAYREGDIVTLDALADQGNWSFFGPVRILAREWHPDSTCTLEVAEWLAD